MNIFTYLKRHSVLAVTIGSLAIIIMIIAGRVAARKSASQAATGSEARQVSLVEVSQFRNGTSTIKTDGTIESVSQADLKSQISAPLAVVNVSVGQSVSAGQTLVQLQSADIRAQLEQARASLSLAQGQYGTGGVSVSSARQTAIDKIRDSYNAADDAVHARLDLFLFNSAGGEAPLSSYVSDYQIGDRIRATRTDLTKYFVEWKNTINGLSVTTSSDAEITAALAQSKTILDTVGRLLDDVSFVINDASKNVSSSVLTTLNAWKASVTVARTAISAASASITTANTSLSGSSSQGSPAEAQVSIAQAGVKNLEAQLAKTIITSPISGKVAALPLRAGELATPGQLIASVVGGGGLEVKAFVSGEDMARIPKGASVLIQGKVAGTVESVAPSVSQTNKKVEVRILVNNPENSGLVVGQNVPVIIKANDSGSVNGAANTSYVLPIQDVKIIPGDAYVLTIDENSKVVRQPVTLGAVEGDFVEVKGGLTDDMKIVSPVYELEEGQAVDVR